MKDGEDTAAIEAKTNDADAGADEGRRGALPRRPGRQRAGRRRAAVPRAAADGRPTRVPVAPRGGSDEKVVDADFEEVDDRKGKSATA